MAIGNLAAAVPVGVLPQIRFTSFQESHIFPMLAQAYHDGITERSVIVDGVNPAISNRSWQVAASLTSTSWGALKTFFEAHKGGVVPFKFYNPFEVLSGHAIGSNYDATGTSTQGRYTVRFTDQAWSETVGLARVQVSFSLVQVA